MSVKIRMHIQLSQKALQRLEELEKNQKKRDNPDKNYKSAIIEALIMSRVDRLETIKERKRDLAKELNLLIEEEETIMAQRAKERATIPIFEGDEDVT